MYSSVHSSSVTPQHSASSTLLFNLVMINWFCYRDCGFFSINFSPQRQAPGQCHGHFQMMEWNVSHIFPPAVAQQCSAPLFQPFKKTRFWGPNEIKTLTNLCPSCFCLNMGIPATPLAHLLLEWVSCKKKYNPPGCWHTLYLEQGCCTSFRQNIGPLCDAYEKGWKLKTISTYLVVVCHHALLLQSHQIYLSAS